MGDPESIKAALILFLAYQRDVNRRQHTFPLYFQPMILNIVSRLTGQLVSQKVPSWIVNTFARHYKINLDEAEKNLQDYPSIQALFTRRLKAGARPICGDRVHPADAKIIQTGSVQQGSLIQVKGVEYSLADLVGDEELAKQHQNSGYMTYYLCPTDYHRVHSPISAIVKSVRHIPGELWPVNKWGVNKVHGLFARNERVIFELEEVGSNKPWLLVMVGALNVGQIEVVFDPEIRTNALNKLLSSNTVSSLNTASFVKTYSPEVQRSVGAELGVFHMGSSVVLISSALKGEDLAKYLNRNVRLGQPICSSKN